jgi:hypothetical protein
VKLLKRKRNNHHQNEGYKLSLYIIIFILSGIGLIIATILLVPFHIILKLTNNCLDYEGIFQIKWMNINILKKSINSKCDKPSNKKFKWNFKEILKVLEIFLNAVPYFTQIFEILIKSIRVNDFQIKVLFGLDSPVDTVQLTGIFLSIKSMITSIDNVSLIICPKFDERIFESSLSLEFQMKASIILKMIQLYTKKPVRKLIHELLD